MPLIAAAAAAAETRSPVRARLTASGPSPVGPSCAIMRRVASSTAVAAATDTASETSRLNRRALLGRVQRLDHALDRALSSDAHHLLVRIVGAAGTLLLHLGHRTRGRLLAEAFGAGR